VPGAEPTPAAPAGHPRALRLLQARTATAYHSAGTSARGQLNSRPGGISTTTGPRNPRRAHPSDRAALADRALSAMQAA
jgi:hypothetical protein